ncbi:Uncharacterized protein dnl_31280 [Desulfonema limicola]|uniref:Uncharacterized protein n=1 Tax=Desulfonema limicola TaxID=45656 RepID=A0A975B8N8_9BACT|nr:Uncharacterized protein dnl_31280 [Desulfonema limicola]
MVNINGKIRYMPSLQDMQNNGCFAIKIVFYVCGCYNIFNLAAAMQAI